VYPGSCRLLTLEPKTPGRVLPKNGKRDRFEAFRDDLVCKLAGRRDITGSALRVATVMAAVFVNRKIWLTQNIAVAWPSQRTLAGIVGQDLRNLGRTIRELIAKGVIKIHAAGKRGRPGSGKNNTRYRFLIADTPAVLTPETAPEYYDDMSEDAPF